VLPVLLTPLLLAAAPTKGLDWGTEDCNNAGAVALERHKLAVVPVRTTDEGSSFFCGFPSFPVPWSIFLLFLSFWLPGGRISVLTDLTMHIWVRRQCAQAVSSGCCPCREGRWIPLPRPGGSKKWEK